MTVEQAVTGSTGWSRFWNRGRWWKVLILVVAYLAIYEPASFLVTPLLPYIGDSNSASYVLVLFVLPILFGAIILTVFGLTVGWFRDLFARQPIGGRGWMWIAVAVVLVFNIIHLASIDYSKVTASWVLTWLLAGLMIGFAEEVLTRGYVVRIMRQAGHKEVAVGLVSAAVFALLHAVNLITGQAVLATLIQIPYTFFFGICMYLALRVTRTIIAPILLHASTDPTVFMQVAHPAPGALSSIGGLGNPAVVVVGIVLLVIFLITRGSTTGELTEIQAGSEHLA